MRITLVVVVVLGLFAREAAADKAGAQAAFGEGQQRYADGDYLAAATKFEYAYALDPDPVYLFNIAQAYRLGNACRQAATYYKRFLGEVPNAPNLAKVNQYLEQSETCAKNTALMEPEPAPPPATPGVGVSSPPSQPPIAERPMVDDPGKTRRWIGIGTMVVGGGALVAGMYFLNEGRSVEKEVAALQVSCTRQNTCEGAEYVPTRNDLEEQGDRANRRAWIALPLGGAVVLGGVALYLLSGSPDPERPAISVMPTTGGAFAVGTFSF